MFKDNAKKMTIESQGSPKATLKEDTGSLPVQSIVYVLVSIMSAQYQNPAPIEKMMLEVHTKYGNSNIPIVYVCGDTVYNITKPFLYNKNAERDPVEKGRTGWLKKHDEAMKKLESTEEISLHHKIVYWDTIKAAPGYLDIKKFTDAVFNPSLTLSKLQEIYPSIDENDLQNLIQDIKSTKILDNVPIIANEFKSKNLSKLERKTEKEIKEANKFRAQLAQTGVLSPKKLQESNSDTELQKLLRGLMLATYNYLAEEFAVFLFLNFLQDAAIIRNAFDLQPLEGTDKLKPILSYPISVTKGSDTIFDTFRILEALYLKYSPLLRLPIIQQPATIIDPFMPETPYKQYEGKLFGRITYDRKQMALTTETAEYNILHPAESPKPTTTSIYSSNSSSSLFHPINIHIEQIDLEEYADHITTKIIQKIDKHSEPITIRTLYKNGITCEITGSNRLNKGDQITNLFSIKDAIRSSVFNALVRNEEEENVVIFNYKNHHFELVVRPTAPSPTFSDRETAHFNLK